MRFDDFEIKADHHIPNTRYWADKCLWSVENPKVVWVSVQTYSQFASGDHMFDIKKVFKLIQEQLNEKPVS